MENAYMGLNSLSCSVCGAGMYAQGTDNLGIFTVWCPNSNCVEHNVRYVANAPQVPLTPEAT